MLFLVLKLFLACTEWVNALCKISGVLATTEKDKSSPRGGGYAATGLEVHDEFLSSKLALKKKNISSPKGLIQRVMQRSKEHEVGI